MKLLVSSRELIQTQGYLNVASLRQGVTSPSYAEIIHVLSQLSTCSIEYLSLSASIVRPTSLLARSGAVLTVTRRYVLEESAIVCFYQDPLRKVLRVRLKGSDDTVNLWQRTFNIEIVKLRQGW